jgi:cytochrome b561
VVILGSLRLPRIAPFDADLCFVLRQTHSLLAYALAAVVAVHVSAVLWHTLALRDGMLSRMTFARRRETVDGSQLGSDSGSLKQSGEHNSR